MADNDPSNLSADEQKDINQKIKNLLDEKKRRKGAGESIDGLNKQIRALKKESRERGKSTDSRASGTTVGTTHTSRETHDQIIHRWNEEIKELSTEISDLQSQGGHEDDIKKIRKKISKTKNKLKKRKTKHNTGAATPDTVKSVAQSLLSQMTAAASAKPGAKNKEKPKCNVKETGLVEIIQSNTNSSLFPMLPPPILNEKITECIRKSGYYDAYHEYTPTQTHYSYESYAHDDRGEKPQTDVFYIHMQVDRKKKNNKTIKVNNNYVAYVNEKSYFSDDMDTLRTKVISGYLYMSVSCIYEKDNKKHDGIITFLIPYSKMESDAPVSNNTVCAIETAILLPSEEIKTLKIFMEKFGNYAYASNIPLDSEGISMTENNIRALVRRFTNIQKHKKTLVRTYKGFNMKDQVTIWANINCKKASGTTDWMAKIKMLLPYIRTPDIIEAKNIIANAIGQCQYAVFQYHKLHPGGDSREFFEHIWATTVWILIAEMSKEKMINQRIADLSTGIMQKFKDVYLRDTQFKADWRKFLEHKIPTTPVLSLDNIIFETQPKKQNARAGNDGSESPTNVVEESSQISNKENTRLRDW
jgi:hypothetical protein